MSLLTRHSTRPRPVSTNIISGLRNAVIKNTGNPDGIVESHERYADRCFSHPHEGQYSRQTDNIELLHESLFLIARNPVMLAAAYHHCRTYGGGTAGTDGLTYADYPSPEETHLLWPLMRDLSKALHTGTFEVGAMREATIPKAGRPGTRTLTIANLETRWVERAVLSTIRPLLERQFLDYSVGGRPGYQPEDAFRIAREALEEQQRDIWLVFDIRAAFDVIPQSQLFEVLRKWLRNSSVCGLIESLAANPGRDHGIRQGSSLSPALLNVYCHHFFDQWWHEAYPEIPMVRFVDDIAIFCGSVEEAETVFPQVEEKLLAAGLQIKETLEEALLNLGEAEPAHWLGVVCHAVDGKLDLRLSDAAWCRLEEKLERAAIEGKTESQTAEIITAWVSSFAHAIPQDDFSLVMQRILEMLNFRPIRHLTADALSAGYAAENFSFS